MYGLDGILEMARIKKAFDPNCILNLDNIFSRDVLKLA
jgi:FAD/FMN-containing dehydrogenase